MTTGRSPLLSARRPMPHCVPAPRPTAADAWIVRMQRMTTAAPSLEATSAVPCGAGVVTRAAGQGAVDARPTPADCPDLGLRHGLMETELYAGIIESDGR